MGISGGIKGWTRWSNPGWMAQRQRDLGACNCLMGTQLLELED